MLSISGSQLSGESLETVLVETRDKKKALPPQSVRRVENAASPIMTTGLPEGPEDLNVRSTAKLQCFETGS